MHENLILLRRSGRLPDLVQHSDDLNAEIHDLDTRMQADFLNILLGGRFGYFLFFLFWGGGKGGLVRGGGRGSVLIENRGRGGVPSMTALSVLQHKRICTIAFGGSTWTDEIALGLRRKKSFSLAERTSIVKRSVEHYLP